MSALQAMLDALEDRLELPYPKRAWVMEEIAADLEACVEQLRADGASEAEAVAGAQERFSLAESELAELSNLHLPRLRAVLGRTRPATRELAEALLSALPFCSAVFVVSLEVPMLTLIREGGASSWLVVLIGLFALAIQLRRAVLWFVLRDHSEGALRRHDQTPLFLAGGVTLLALAGCALGYFTVLGAWTAGKIDLVTMHAGLIEPLSCLILGGVLAALIVLLQGALGAGLRAMRVPERRLAASE